MGLEYRGLNKKNKALGYDIRYLKHGAPIIPSHVY